MEFDAFSSGDVPLDTSPCRICGRNFNQTALARHEPICIKSSQKSRKVFDSSKQRAEGTEITQLKKAQSRGRGPASQKAAPPPPKNNWRAKHEDFINAIRSAKGVQKAIDSGGPLPPPPPPSINPDYIQCPHCSRRFNQQAAERHINFCREQHARLPGKKPDASESAKFNARKQYKVPRPSLKTSQKIETQPTQRGFSSTKPSARGGRTNTRASPATNYNNNYESPSQSSYSASRYSDYGTESPNSGRALRTGRTAEGYTDARELSAKQRSNMPRTKSTPNTTGRYGGNYGKKTPGSTTTTFGNSSTIRDNGYYSGDSDQVTSQYNSQSVNKGGGLSKFCHECGTRYPVATAKFCCECGVRRMAVQ